MKIRYLFALTLAAALMGSSTPAPASETDDRIESSFQQSYVYKTYLKDDKIKINAQDGVVTLAGSVANSSHKTMAADTAEALPGVKRVDNQITITGDQSTKDSDTWTSMKVKAALLYRRNVSGTQTEVFVKDGVVTLKGQAANQAQKDLAAEYAKDIHGVKSVVNQITVAPATAPTTPTVDEKIDDASITAQVKGALLTHRSTSALTTKVTTNDGVVTVSGQAANIAEKTLVTKLVTDIHGVTSVINNMTIAPTVSHNQ